MKGEVAEVVHGDKAVFVILDDRSSRMYKREDIRLKGVTKKTRPPETLKCSN